MPQLNKGGKFVFGLSVIRPDLTIHIPPQALLEYGATRDGKVIIFTGSKITGGFCVTTYSLLSNSKLKHILEDCPALRDCLLSEGEFIQYKGRKYAWLDIDKNGVIKLPHSTLAVLDLQSGMELLAIRSSDIAFTMGAKGPLLQKAHNFQGSIGFMALLLFPLLNGIVAFKQNGMVEGIISISSFVLSLIFFACFVMGDKEQFQNTLLKYEGLWERLTLFCMYIPFVYKSMSSLFF